MEADSLYHALEELPLFAALATPSPSEDRHEPPPAWLDELDSLTPDDMTPRQALEALYRLKRLRAGEDG